MSRRIQASLAALLIVVAVGCRGRTGARFQSPVARANDSRDAAVAPKQVTPAAVPPPLTGCPSGMTSIGPGAGAGLVCMDFSEVTVAEYRACVERGLCSEPKSYDTSIRLDRYRALCNWHHPEDRRRHPINCITRDQAAAYCSSRGARLPLDVEWTLAASNGGQSLYPWGAAPPDRSRVNGCGHECPPGVRRAVGHAGVAAQYAGEDGFVGTAPVGSFPRGDNRAGIHDLAGNVAELVVPRVAPDSTGDLTAGGGFLTQKARMMSARELTRTAWSGATSPDLGFRCVKDVP